MEHRSIKLHGCAVYKSPFMFLPGNLQQKQKYHAVQSHWYSTLNSTQSRPITIPWSWRSIFYNAITFCVRLLYKDAMTAIVNSVFSIRNQVDPVSKCNGRQTYRESEDRAPYISNLDSRRRLTATFWLPINLYCTERILGSHCLCGHMGSESV